MPIEPGNRVGDYEVLSEIGAGGMGKVFRVRNVISDRIEAMKVLLPNLTDAPDLFERFAREIKVQAALHHPNIAGLHTAFHFENQLVMVMEFVEGVSLDKKLKAGAIPLHDCVDYICQVLRALSYAHQHGVIHRDLKPANMMLTPDGRVKLMDFGIAKVAADPKLTGTGTTVGSLYYMSPEQIRGQPPDPRSDLYSLGIALYELVTGRRPIQGTSDFSIMSAHLSANPVPPIEIDHSLPASLNSIILTAISKEPGQRFQTADAFYNALDSVRTALQGSSHAETEQMLAGGLPIGGPATPIPMPMGAIPPPPPPPPMVAVRAKSNRALYMILGAVAALAVLAVAAVEAPRWLKTSARETTPQVNQAAQTPQVAATPQSAASQTAAPPQVQAPTAATPTAQTEPPTQLVPSHASVQQAQAQPQSVVVASVPPAQHQAPRQVSPQSSPPATPVQQAAQTPPPQPTQQAAQPAAQVTAPAQPAVSPEELAKLDERMTQLGARAGTADQSLESLRRTQAASGLSPRADAVAAQHLMRNYLAQAQSAMQAQDLRAAKSALDKAETQIEKLEKIFGQ